MFVEEESSSNEKVEESRVVYFGDCPGLAYFLGKPAAIDTTWPDLDSYSVKQLEDGLANLEENPIIIIRNTEPTSDSYVEKQELLQNYMSTNYYEATYQNDGYTVYQPQKR